MIRVTFLMRLKYSLIRVTILIREKIAENIGELVLDQRVGNPDKTEI